MTFPSQFMLVAAMNPTPDGKMPAESRLSPHEIQKYLGRTSGPLLDRFLVMGVQTSTCAGRFFCYLEM